jgi:hypothetical protein
MASRPPLVGYNHNIRYANRVYHVQTEDSGVDTPHIFTHVFLAGMIISSAKTDYKELAAEAGHEERVKKLMQDQHKRLMKDLRRGGFDDKIIALVGSLEPVAEAVSAWPEGGIEIEAPAAAGVEAAPAEIPAGVEAMPAEIPATPAGEAELVAEAPAAVELVAEAPAAAELVEEAPAAAELARPEPAATAPALPEVAPPSAPTPASVEPSPTHAQEDTLEVSAASARSDTDEHPTTGLPEPPEASESELHTIRVEPTPEPAAPASARHPTLPPAPQPPLERPPLVVETRARGRGDETIPWIPSESTPAPSERRRPPTGAPAAVRRGLAEPPPVMPQIEVKISESPLETARPAPGLHVEVTERIDMRAALRAHASAGAEARGRERVAPRIPGPLGPTEGRRERADESTPSVIVDRPPGEETEETPLVTPTFYSQVRRAGAAADDPLRTQLIGAKTITPEQPRSKVFGKPVPGAPVIPRPEDRTPVGPLEPRRSGVYPVPTLPVRPPHPDPIVRGGAQKPTYGSTPQRYTAPSRMSATPVALPKRRSPTGTYERSGWSRPPGLPSASMVAPSARPAPGRPPVPPRTPAGGVPVGARTPATGVPAVGRTPTAPAVARTPTGAPAVARTPATGVPVRARPPSAPSGTVQAGRPGARAPTGGTQPVRPPAAGVPARPRPPSTPPTAPARPPSTPRSVGAARPVKGSVSPIPRVGATDRPGVVVARPVIISEPVKVGEAPPGVRPAPAPRGAPQPRPPRTQTPASPPRAVKEGSVFGAGLITERSLDEVILSYLAEDVESSDE